MGKFRIWTTAIATHVIDIEAVDEQSAREKFDQEYAGSSIFICHQCSDEISDPSVSEEISEIHEVTDDG